MDAGLILGTFTGAVKSGVITPPSSESGVITSLPVKSGKSTAMFIFVGLISHLARCRYAIEGASGQGGQAH